MGLWRNFVNWLGSGGASGRTRGVQNSQPGNYGTRSATPVTVDSALQLSAVWACAKLLTESISSLPVIFYKKNTDGSRAVDTQFHLAKLFSGKVNRWQTRPEYFETITYQYALLGNNYSVKQKNSKGEIINLVPLMTEQMQVILGDDGGVLYQYTDSSGVRVYAQDTIWHNKLFGNGIIGLSPLGYARNSVGVGQAAEAAVTKIYANGGKPSGLLTIDRILTDTQRAAIKKNFAELSEGNEERLFVLEADMKYSQVSLSPQDIELLASRRFQIEDICRFWGVPSILVNDAQSTTAWGSGMAHIIQGFYKFGLRPYLERYKASIICNLMTPAERAEYDVDFDLTALLRPEFMDRLKGFKDGVQGGIITPNEARAYEGLPQLPGGDKLYMQQQMAPMDMLEKLDRSGMKNAQQTENKN